MAWCRDWAARARGVATHGLPATVVGLAWLDDMLVLELDAPEAALQRSHAVREFPLHISVLFQGELLHNDLQLHCEIVSGANPALGQSLLAKAAASWA